MSQFSKCQLLESYFSKGHLLESQSESALSQEAHLVHSLQFWRDFGAVKPSESHETHAPWKLCQKRSSETDADRQKNSCDAALTEHLIHYL